jgi:hypothetical protein
MFGSSFAALACACTSLLITHSARVSVIRQAEVKQHVIHRDHAFVTVMLQDDVTTRVVKTACRATSKRKLGCFTADRSPTGR